MKLMSDEKNDSSTPVGPVNSEEYQREYSGERFWEKLRLYARTAGRDVIEKGLWLYYAAQRPETPVWAKAVIYGALGYFILPMDSIPDLTPVVGYSDDLGAVVLAVAVVASYINDEVKTSAKEKLQHWFKDKDDNKSEPTK